MAYPTSVNDQITDATAPESGNSTVNSQITDAVTQSNVKVLGEVPAMAMGTIYQTMAQSVGLSMQNAVSAQQQMNVIAQAATTQGVNLIYSIPTEIELDDLHHHDHDDLDGSEP
ncbi:MAG TPA: RebB family R body protein [Thermoanaerobaculia bacterium]|nr:RebB family R body protein [Thermoanaerobaculia bacterium]